MNIIFKMNQVKLLRGQSKKIENFRASIAILL